MKALLYTFSRDPETVARALNVDNVKEDKLRIRTKAVGGYVVSEVETKKLPTMLNCLDDLIACQMIAERILSENG